MPEKTRDRKNWFPRFKSNWLGTYRSKQMFLCCECAVTDAESARYKGAEGKHCVCGRDQWHLAKSVEEAEYNRRMEISKSLGGIRYEEAVERIKGMGGCEYDYDDKRVRCESDESSASTASVHSTESSDYLLHSKHVKTEAPQSLSPASRGAFTHELKLSMGPSAYGYDQQHLVQPPAYTKGYAPAHNNNANYAPLPADMLGSSPYDHLAPPAFTDEESFGELLQGILEEDPRHALYNKMAHHQAAARAAPYPPYAHTKRYPESLAPAASASVEFDFYPNGSSAMAAHGHHQHGYSSGYQQSHYPYHHHHHQSVVPAVAAASFPSAV